MRTRTARAPRRAAAAVELGFVAPLFFILLVGIWEIGRLVHVQQIVTNAAREGSRQAATGKYTKAEVTQAVLDYLANAGYSLDGVLVDVTNVTRPAAEVKDANQMEHVRVVVRYPFDNVRWFNSGGFSNNAARDVQSGGFDRPDAGTDYAAHGPGRHVPTGTMIRAQADWFVMADVPLSVPTTIPSSPLP